ncbi:putative membrane protein [Nocardia transvalensis]|uniref:Putative membrane protein n=1 Tax=Nocardia transvalensis TaxID=37333 RepID=A0A7W9PNC0_9NOCA|nr:hypothetical protein [Nocardia transvalensis]MBB5918839.1 putative membrane protein [Nocardia transvalensis]
MSPRRRKRQASHAPAPSRTSGAPARLFGLGLAGAGAAHFTAPQVFDQLTGVAFPSATRQWTYRNGFTELLLGLAIAYRRTRTVGAIGLIAYVAFLGSRVVGRTGDPSGAHSR